MTQLPAETHQHGRGPATPDEVLELLVAMLGDTAPAHPSQTTRDQLELTDMHGRDLWADVCEELGERSLGPDFDPATWVPGSTLEELAVLMASALADQDPYDIGRPPPVRLIRTRRASTTMGSFLGESLRAERRYR